MKKLYMRFALIMFAIVVVSSFVASGLSVFVGMLVAQNTVHYERQIFFTMRLRDLLVPLFTIASSIFLVSVLSKKAAAPIVALSKTTKEIAKGNFDISIMPSMRKDEIGELEKDFGLMVQELRSNEVMKKDFIANVSHEFKTPLSVIQGYGRLLSDDALTADERRQYAEKVESESQRLIALTSNILRLSKLESQAIMPTNSQFQLDEQLRQSVLTLQSAWSKRNILFELHLRPQPYEGDEELLSQVWLNLIDNAIKFSSDGGTIQIRMTSTENGILIKITDHGIGMDETTKAHMFEQFYQGDASRSREGSGLGLPIVKRIVDLHHGGIDVESRLGEGTRVLVTLPM